MNKIVSAKNLILVIAILSTLFLIIAPFIDEENVETQISSEIFDGSLKRLTSVDAFIDYADSLSKVNKIDATDTVAYVNLVSDLVKNRFVYGLANYKFINNWPVYLSGKIFWSHFSAKVDPDHILKNSIGLCSQQTIVFMEVLKRKNISTRSVGLGPIEGPGHFICEVKYNGSWHMFDVTKEPNWEAVSTDHQNMSYYLEHKDSLYLIYKGILDEKELNTITNMVSYGEPNVFPAKKMLLFQKACYIFMYLFPLICFLIFLRMNRKQK